MLRKSYIWFGLLLLPLAAVAAFAIFQPIQVLPRISLAPGFSLVTHDGGRLTNEDLRGSFVFYTFTYASCEDGCAQTAETLLEIEQAVAELDTGGIPIEFVAISFDPERDTPQRLAELAAQLGVESDNWHFATGDAQRLKNVIGRGFRAYYEERDDGSFAFDPTIVLVDGWGIQRAKYRTARPDPDRIRRDVGMLVDELENQEGVSRLAYEAAHLFLCYPD